MDATSDAALYQQAAEDAQQLAMAMRAEVERLRDALHDLAESARQFSTEADYTVSEAVEAEFVDALEAAERRTADITDLPGEVDR